MHQKVCLNLVKKDQLCAIALMNRKWILKVLLKMVAMVTNHSLLRKCFKALTPTLPALLENKIWLSNKHIVQVFVLFRAMNLSFGS